MTKQQPKEITIVTKILKYLNSLPGCRAIKTHGGMYGRSGEPDITGCLDGRRIEIEVKRPGNKPTELQHEALAKWQAAGAIAGWVTSVEEVEQLLRPQIEMSKRLDEMVNKSVNSIEESVKKIFYGEGSGTNDRDRNFPNRNERSGISIQRSYRSTVD